MQTIFQFNCHYIIYAISFIIFISFMKFVQRTSQTLRRYCFTAGSENRFGIVRQAYPLPPSNGQKLIWKRCMNEKRLPTVHRRSETFRGLPICKSTLVNYLVVVRVSRVGWRNRVLRKQNKKVIIFLTSLGRSRCLIPRCIGQTHSEIVQHIFIHVDNTINLFYTHLL